MRIFTTTILLILISLYSCSTTNEDPKKWLTYYELSGCLKTPRYKETIEYCQKLDKSSPYIKLTEFGISPQGRKLPLIIVDFDRDFTPEKQKKSGKALLLIQAGIHPGEIDGKDAGLMLIRDIAIHKKFPEIMKNITLLFIPIFNVDGHERFGPYNRINQNGPKEMGWRVTAQNLNLNRDFMKADCPEMQAWLELFTKWLPDLIVDSHVTDGADYQYVITYGLETHSAIVEPVRAWNKNIFLPHLEQKMEESGFPLSPYVNLRDWNNIKEGISSGVMGPRFSNGYGTIQNRTCLLVENHMLKDYKTRVDATYELFRQILVIANKEYKSLKKSVLEGDKITASLIPGTVIPLNYKVASDSVMIDFKGISFKKEYSEISGTDRIIWTGKPVTYHIPLFKSVVPSDVATIPYAYIIPPEWTDVINIFHLHGIKTLPLKKEISITVASYKFSNPRWQERPYEGRHYVNFDLSDTVSIRTFPVGSAVAILNQRTNKVIINLLEPKAPDSFIRWGFLDVVFERKEYAESYVLEEMARSMLNENSALRSEFEKKLNSDPAFASNPRERLMFFYKRSPYWDEKINLYPIVKIMEQVDLSL